MRAIKQSIIHILLAMRPFFRILFPEKFRRMVRSKLYRSENHLVLRTAEEPENLRDGVMIYGMFAANTGMGNAARLLAEGCEKTVENYSLGMLHSNSPESRVINENLQNKLTEDNFEDTNLFVFNADSVEYFLQQIGAGVLKGRYNIAHWSWELPEFPDFWQDVYEYFDEFWTISEFCRKAIVKKVNKPVRVVHYGVSVSVNHQMTRTDFGLPENRILFLCMADAKSILARKNPLGALLSYCKAFPLGSPTGLVIKLSGGDDEEDTKKMLSIASRRNDIFFIRESLSGEQVNTLMSLCDVFVSLHRAEGFGLPIAEAMLLGKSVVVTGWSGNMDYTDPSNACCVKYSLQPVGKNAALPYESWQLWAEPDLDDAAYHMRFLAENEEQRKKLGEAARSRIIEEYSPLRCGRDISFNLRYRRSV